MSDDAGAVGVGLVAIGAAVLYLFRDRLAGVVGAESSDPGSIFERVREVSADGELVVDPVTGVFYDDPEQGPLDDEAGDDRNLSFASVNEGLAKVGGYLDPTQYAPDVQDGAIAPSGGVLADVGESMNWGEAPEAENDDLTQRAAESNLSDDEKAMFDRLANVDDVSRLDDSRTTDVVEEDSSSGSSSSGSTTSYYSGSSGGLSSGGSTSTDDEEEKDPFAHLYDETDPNSGGLTR